MIGYPNHIEDHHVVTKFREIIDALNALEPKTAATAAAVAAMPAPTIPQIQQALQAGGSNPLNVMGLQGLLASSQVASQVGTHAQRLASKITAGTFWWETDRTILYLGVPSGQATVWTYAAGAMFATFANRPTDLAANDAGFLLEVSDHLHLCRWSGTAWVILDNDAGTFVESAVALGTGYQLCDGTATNYLTVSGADLAETAFTTPNENGGAAGVYHKSIAAYTGTINPASTPTGTFTGMAGNTGNDSATQTVQSGAGATVPAEPHTHPFTPAGTITINLAGGDPVRNLGVLRYFRR